MVEQPRPSPQQWARAHPHGYDAAAAVVFSVLALLVTQESAAWAIPVKSVNTFHLLVAALAGLPHVVRRIAPISAFLLSVGSVAGAILVKSPDPTVQVIVWWFVAYSVAANHDPRVQRIGRVLITVLSVALLVTIVVLVLTESSPAAIGSWGRARALLTSIAAVAAVIGTAWFGGVASRAKDAHVALLAERSREVAEREAARAQQAVLDERVRISRELHDVVAHHVSVMGVQAGAARRLMQRDTAAASALLSDIEQSSRSAIAEMGRVVALLRSDTDQTDLIDGSAIADATPVDAPQPGIAQLERLIEQAAGAGMNVSLDVKGEQTEVPPSVGLSVYRIVQESLTNVRKHAGLDAQTDVALRFSSTSLELAVINRGRIESAKPTVPGSLPGRPGHGQLGMRERASLVGGTLQVGPVAGGYQVRATLPLQRVADA
jgi:signal transduction histidine kinase